MTAPTATATATAITITTESQIIEVLLADIARLREARADAERVADQVWSLASELQRQLGEARSQAESYPAYLAEVSS